MVEDVVTSMPLTETPSSSVRTEREMEVERYERG